MKSTSYSEKVLDHFRNPRNVGTLKGDDVAIGRVGNPVCGDLMEFYIRVKNNRIEDIRFKTFGCGSAIATASMITELAKGKTLEQALSITRKDVADELDGLPPIKMHCSNLAADALKDAIRNFQNKKEPKVKATENSKISGNPMPSAEKFLGKGVYLAIENPSLFSGKRTLVVDRGEASIDTAIALTEQSPRVVFVSGSAEKNMASGIKEKLHEAGVKMLYQSEILEIMGVREVEKVRIHNMDEDEEYELFVDAVVMLP
ncbi:iron-sulfur cluster assembly scaffold protein [candidate division WOR-3 bacterium]|nr:iron-sulfur cluster assembly scaffold protein [candidate division WOR-3 bacterium]